MTIKKSRHIKGIILPPDAIALEGIEGELKVDSADKKIKTTLDSVAREVVTNSQSQTLTNKTLTSPVIDTGVSGTAIDIDGTFAANSDTKLASQKAIKTYVDTAVAGKDQASEISVAPAGTISSTNVQAALEELDGDIQAHLNDTADAHDASAISVVPIGNLVSTDVQAALQELQGDADNSDAHIAASTNVHGLAVGSSVVGTTDSQQLTNKTIIGASIESPIRLDPKLDTRANLETYALTATNGQLVFATDDKQAFQVIDGALVAIGGAALVKITAGENLTANDCVYISLGTGSDTGRTAGRVYKADASNDDRVDVLGFVTKTATSGNIAEIQLSGLLPGFTSRTAGNLQYLSASSPGAITETPPSTQTHWIVAVAQAYSATQININPVSAAGAIYIEETVPVATIANNQASATNLTGVIFDPLEYRGVILDYAIYRITDTASSAVVQVGELRLAYNTQSTTWYLSDNYAGQNAGVTFSISGSGQIQYTSSDIAGANYIGTMEYSIKSTFGV
jgi:hypothetical protein